jgi:four helix bundle protein
VDPAVGNDDKAVERRVLRVECFAQNSRRTALGAGLPPLPRPSTPSSRRRNVPRAQPVHSMKQHIQKERGGVTRRQSSVESGRSRAFRFERIEAWQLARAFNKAVYRAARGFPKDEMFALTSQIRRASVSVSSNIAEGSGRNSDADFAHFLEIAYGSLMEVVSQLYLALDQGYVRDVQFDELLAEADVLASKLVALSKALGRKPRIAGRQPRILGRLQSRAESGASRAQSSESPRP